MKHCYLLLIGLLPIAFIVAAPEGKLKGQGAGQGGQVEPAEVPPYLFNVWLCRPSAESVTVSVLAWEDMEAFIEYGDGLKTAAVKLKAGVPENMVLGGLKPDTRNNYHVTYRRAGGRRCRMRRAASKRSGRRNRDFPSSCRRTRISTTTPMCGFISKR